MGSGTFNLSSFADYRTSLGCSYDTVTGRSCGQEFKSVKIDESLNPKNFNVRECVNSVEHPNTIPVILALDVTGSMGSACKETAETLGIIVNNLYSKFNDIEFCIMGIGDIVYDSAPIQMSQFESDVRIAESIDKLFMEHGGGGNGYESYTAAWYMGLKKTKLDCFDKQGRKGIIITMGDEPLNPYLSKDNLNQFINGNEEKNIETDELYIEVQKKFDVFHIAVDDLRTSYSFYKNSIKNTFGNLLKERLKISTIQNLASTIENCITEALQNNVFLTDSFTDLNNKTIFNENGEITW